MPTLQLKVSPLQNPENYQALARALNRLAHATLLKNPEVTAVMVDDIPAARWAVGGTTVHMPTAMLEISITAGTNTAEQKAAFIAQAFDVLERLVGQGRPLEPASYVIVREVNATDWGYGGITQAARKQVGASHLL